MPLSTEVVQNLKKSVDTACADPKTSIPGTSVVVVGKDGKELFAHAAGKRGAASSENMTLDNVFWIASCTKMIAGLACMQLVEQGKLHLDDGDEMETLVPELKETKVLQKDGSLAEKKGKITLRMLLSHTGMSDSHKLERLLADYGEQLVSAIPSLTNNCATFRRQTASITNSRAVLKISSNRWPSNRERDGNTV
jgi:CubicO group peptidase (beta-lactamase class C family)